MHYDAFPPEKFHAAAIAKWRSTGAHPARLKEFARNAKMWQDICNRILDASSACVRPDAAFALQLGDLVQGDCESDDLHRQMLAEATAMLDRAYPHLPVVSVCGNHDIREGDRDEGAAGAYAGFMADYETRRLASFLPQGVRTTTFGFRCGPDLWIALDFNFGARDAGIVRRLLADNPDVRYTFVATHGPVLPMDLWRSRWFYLGQLADDALFDEYRSGMRRYYAARAVGHHVLHVSDDAVSLDYYGHDATTPTGTFFLRQ